MLDKLAEHEEVLKQAEKVLSMASVQQVVEKKEESAAFATFKQQADLKPSMLEREANFAEAKHFTEIFTNYLENGYGGAARVPQQMIAVQLQPFVCEIWWAQMIQLEIKKKNLKEAMKVVMDVASENNPVHGRRMDLLKMRRGSQDHSQWLYKLETAMELTKWEDWTKESMIVHLFLESADTEMSKLATAMLAKESVNLSDLRMEIRAIENSTWYKPKFQAKYVQQPKTWETDGVEGAGGPGVPNGGLKWCGDCKSKTHNTEACWGVCPHCGKRGHRQEFCNRRSEDIEKAKAAKRAEKQKKKREKRKLREKQNREAAKAAQTTDKTPIPSTSSCSEVVSLSLRIQGQPE